MASVIWCSPPLCAENGAGFYQFRTRLQSFRNGTFGQWRAGAEHGRIPTTKTIIALSAGIASAAALASAAEKFPVPGDTGLYLGAGVYEESGRMLCGGFCFTYWEPGTLDPTGCVRLAAAEVAQFRAEDFGAEWRAERNDASGEDVQRWPRKGSIRHTAAKPASARRRTARK